MKTFNSIFICNINRKKVKSLFLLLFISFFFNFSCFSQQINLNFNSKDRVENDVIKKLKVDNYLLSKKNVDRTIDSITNILHLTGYFNLEKEIISKNDSVLNVTLKLGKQYEKIKIVRLTDTAVKDEVAKIINLNIKNDSFEIAMVKLPYLLTKLVTRYEKKGQSFTQFSLTNINLIDDLVIAEIKIKKSKIRTIDKVIVKGYVFFPKTFIKHQLNITKKSTFNNSKLNAISNLVKSVSFVEEIKKPQILFTKDSTLLYMYLKKKNSNRFDGLIGFNSNDDSSSLKFTGYLDLHLENMFNYGTSIDLVWKSNANENQKFDLAVTTPYLFNSAFTPKGLLQIYRQDSSYINIKSQLEIEYAMNNRNKIAVSIQSNTSTNLLDDDSQTDFKNFNTTFYGLHYLYKTHSDLDLFPFKFLASLNTHFGQRKSDNIKITQTKLIFSGFYNWQLNYKNYIFTKINSGYLISDNYLDNELFRIGGTNTIRGFQDESIFANLYNSINLEYRYLTKNNSYLYSISDFGFVEKEAVKNKLFGFGIGYAFSTKIGLLNLNYVLGKTENQNFDFSNAVVNLKYVTFF